MSQMLYEVGQRVRLNATGAKTGPLGEGHLGTVVKLNMDHIEEDEATKRMVTLMVAGFALIPVRWDDAPPSADGGDYYLMFPGEFEPVANDG